jgi:quercetin dioxygenase-like cupin family protein
MELKLFIPITFLLVSSCSTQSNKEEKITEERPPVKCMENSPERHGEEGCTILANRPLVGPLADNVFWHIDRFDSLDAAMKIAGPNSVAAEAHGLFWLMTVEARTEDHHDGHHVSWIGPLVLPPTNEYSMRVQSSLLKPGSATPVHTHPGPEVFYIVDGEQCIETLKSSQRLSAGQFYVVGGGDVHRQRIIGSASRRNLALILYDAAYPSSHDLDSPPPLVPCK